MALKKETTGFVRVDKIILEKVKKKISGKRKSIGQFYDEAAEEKLSPKKIKK